MKKALYLLLFLVFSLPGAALAESPAVRCPDLVVADGLLWRVADDAILCEDVEAGSARASLPLPELLEPGEALQTISLAGWPENRVLLTLGLRDAGGGCRVRLLELGLSPDGIAALTTHDATEKLGFLVDDAASWYEVDVVGCGRRLYIAAMDAEYTFRLYLYTPGTDALLPLGERPIDGYLAALPFGDDVLIVGPNPMDDGLLELTRLSLESGETTPLESIPLDSALRAANFAWDDAGERLYYTVNNTVYALTPGSGKAPEAAGALSAMPVELRMGAAVAGRFVALDEQGRLLSCDVHFPVKLSAQLRVANLAADEAVIQAARDFGIVSPGCAVSIVDSVDEESALKDAMTHAPDCDAYVLILNSGLYYAFREAGFMADLSADEALSAAAADMSPRMKASIMDGERLCAMPMSTGNLCQYLNVPGMQALTGRTPEALPTDWPGFLEMLRQLADSGALAGDSAYTLCGDDMTPDSLREQLLGGLIQDCLLWAEADGSAIDRISQAILPALETFNRIDWPRLAPSGGLSSGIAPDAASGGIRIEQADNGRTPLLTEDIVDIAVVPQAEGEAPWPLSVEPGGERLIGQMATVICVNPYGANPETALSFLAHAWEGAGVVTHEALCQSMNAPAVNTDYQEELDYMAGDVAMLQQAITAAKTGEERDYLQYELGQLLAYMEDYRENAGWLTSEESIARYRSYADAMVPTGQAVNDPDLLDTLIYGFLDGEITPDQFAGRFAESLR